MESEGFNSTHPKPAKKRPATNMGISVAAVCSMTPNEKTQLDTIRDIRRPSLSAIGAAASAPKKVPAWMSRVVRSVQRINKGTYREN
jgi:hypothetical protein